MAVCARDVMQSPVISVSPETPLAEVHRLFGDEEIHGAPVISDEGRVLGVITSTDLVNAAIEQAESGAFGSEYLRELVEFSGPDWSRGAPADFQDRLRQVTAEEVMTPSAATVSASMPIGEVAARMHRDRIHRIWVTDHGALVGVISTFDLLPLLAKAAL
jgi:CBS-domain-containing membrane protein